MEVFPINDDTHGETRVIPFEGRRARGGLFEQSGRLSKSAIGLIQAQVRLFEAAASGLSKVSGQILFLMFLTIPFLTVSLGLVTLGIICMQWPGWIGFAGVSGLEFSTALFTFGLLAGAVALSLTGLVLWRVNEARKYFSRIKISSVEQRR